MAVHTDKNFRFELVSPERILLSTEAEMVTIPGEMGDFGVLVHHAPLISSLRPGVIAVTVKKDQVLRFFVSGGFADVSQTHCSVLAETAENLSELDANQIDVDLSHARDDFAMAESHQEKTRLLKHIHILEVKRRAIS